MWGDFQTEPFTYEVPFGLRSLMWSHWGDYVDMQIEFAGDFDPSSELAKRYAYTLQVREKGLVLWYGHNVANESITRLVGRLAPNEVVLVRAEDALPVAVVARGQILLGKGVAWIRLPYRDFDPSELYLHFCPSREIGRCLRSMGASYRRLCECVCVIRGDTACIGLGASSCGLERKTI